VDVASTGAVICRRHRDDVDKQTISDSDSEAAVGGGCDDDDDHHDDDDDGGLAGALEMLPIPCTISCTPGLPAILLVNPP